MPKMAQRGGSPMALMSVVNGSNGGWSGLRSDSCVFLSFGLKLIFHRNASDSSRIVKGCTDTGFACTDTGYDCTFDCTEIGYASAEISYDSVEIGYYYNASGYACCKYRKRCICGLK